MQIKIEIDVKPEELRRFLGLPDVAGLQEDLVQFLREKLGAAGESFDPASFVKDNLQSLRDSSAWKKIVSAAKSQTVIRVGKPLKKAASARRASVDKTGAVPAKKAAASRKRKPAKASTKAGAANEGGSHAPG